MIITSTQFDNCRSDQGGGIDAMDTTLSITNCKFTNIVSNALAGDLLSLEVYDSTFENIKNPNLSTLEC